MTGTLINSNSSNKTTPINHHEPRIARQSSELKIMKSTNLKSKVDIHFSQTSIMGHYEDPTEFWREIKGEIFIIENKTKIKIGFINCFKLEAGKALEFGDMFSIFDAFENTLAAYNYLWDDNIDDFVEDTNASIHCGTQYLILIDMFFLEPKYRNKKIGSIALKRIIQDFGGKETLFALQCLPLQLVEKLHEKFNLSSLTANKVKATKQLKAYYAKHGFQELSCGKYMVYP